MVSRPSIPALLDSPAFTGTPTAPTPATNDESTRIATTALVAAKIAALVASSPAALDTLNELAAALGNDASFATTVTNALAGKAASSHTHTSSEISDSTATGRSVLTGAAQTAKTFLAGPTSGSAAAPTFRALGAGDLGGGIIHPGLVSGTWYAPFTNGFNTVTNTAGRVEAVPVYIPGSTTIADLAISVTAASGAGTKARLGIYTNVSGRPGTLIADVEVSTDSNALQVGAVNAACGGWVWLAAHFQSTPTARSITPVVNHHWTGISNPSSPATSYLMRADGVTYGAMPANFSTFGASFTNFGSGPAIFFRT